MERAAPDGPRLAAVAALDDFVAEIVAGAHARCLAVPPELLDWATEEGTWVVERLAMRLIPGETGVAPGLDTALRCAVRCWVAPYLVARFEPLAQLFPEILVRRDGPTLDVLLRTGRWRCSVAGECGWKLCER